MDWMQQILALQRGVARFEDGRVDYHGTVKAPVINCAIYRPDGSLLVLKRSQQVLAYAGMWNGVSGFIDLPEAPAVVARREVQQELGWPPEVISALEVREPYWALDPAINREWFVFPVRVEVTVPPKIKLNAEHEEYRWLGANEALTLDLLPDFKNVIKRTMNE